SNPMLRVVVPARFASTRLPGKPLLDLAGKPMVVRVHDAVRAALPEAEVVVAVDDQRVHEALSDHNIATVMTDSRHESGTERAAEVARMRSEEHTSELQSRENLVCRLLLEKKKLRAARQK